MAESYDYDYSGENQVTEYGEYGEDYGAEGYVEGYEGGYYDENGEWVYSEAEVVAEAQVVKTDIGEIPYEMVESQGMQFMVDYEGRILNYGKIEAEDPNLADSYEDFISAWQPQQMSAVMDAKDASLRVWPTEPPPVYLKRFDVYENNSKLCHFGTADRAESQRIRHSGDFTAIQSIMLYSTPTQLTRVLTIEKVAPPLRSRFRMDDGKNRRDVTKWYPAESVDAFVQTAGSQGTIPFYIDWTDGPDRYLISATMDPKPGWRRMWRFAGYPVSQYYIIRKAIDHPDLASEGGNGDTCNIVKGTTVFSRKHWRIVGSFFAFDIPLSASTKYTLYTRQDPFHRMKLTLNEEIDHPEEWTEQFSFYAFDIPIPGSCRYELQHCVRYHHTVIRN